MAWNTSFTEYAGLDLLIAGPMRERLVYNNMTLDWSVGRAAALLGNASIQLRTHSSLHSAVRYLDNTGVLGCHLDKRRQSVAASMAARSLLLWCGVLIS